MDNSSIGGSIVALAFSAAVIAYLYFRHKENQRRLEIIHAERLAAMDKGIPLPELPIDPPPVGKAGGDDNSGVLFAGIVLSMFGAGSMLALTGIRDEENVLWPLPLPIVMMGLGMILYYLLARNRPARDSSSRRGQ
jgi:hypothetical protein